MEEGIISPLPLSLQEERGKSDIEDGGENFIGTYPDYQILELSGTNLYHIDILHVDHVTKSAKYVMKWQKHVMKLPIKPIRPSPEGTYQAIASL